MTSSGDWTTGEPRLSAQRCERGHTNYLPRLRCPVCAGDLSDFEPDSAGTVFAQTSLHRRVSTGAADQGSEAIGIALVDLDDGVRVMARCRPGTAIGSRVRVVVEWDAASGRLLPRCEGSAA